MIQSRLLLLIALSLSGSVVGEAVDLSDSASATLIGERDYSFGYWLNGMRKHASDHSADILCLESGYYGFSLDLADLTQARLGRYTESLSYEEALEAGASRLEQLAPVDFVIELESKGTVFRARSSWAGEASHRDARHLQDAWMWESGKVAQHYELHGLQFEDSHGRRLGVDGSLSLVAWPQTLSMTAEIAPSLIYADGWHEGVLGNGLCVVEKPWQVPHDPRLEASEMTVECWVKIPTSLASTSSGYLLAKNGHEGKAGHYSFKIRQGRVTASMNLGPGAEKRLAVEQRGKSFKENAWNHLAMTYDGQAMRFYMNGALQGTKPLVAERSFGDGALMLGQRADGNGGVTSAVFDQVRIWERALSARELKAHAEAPESLVHTDGINYNETFDTYGAAEVRIPVWSDVTVRLRLGEALLEEQVAGVWAIDEKRRFSLAAPQVSTADWPKEGLSIQVHADGEGAFPVEYDPSYNAYVAEVRREKRGWKGSEVANYDEFDLIVENSGQDGAAIPFLFYLRNPAQITGLCPILCDAEGVPTGLPVQLSKNWHYPKLGAYLRGYMLLPAKAGRTTYKLRIAYGFYGSLPSASHAQLSLVGYGGHGRWDQLAIGSWGETFCFDMDMSLVDVAITDVRMLMARKGKDGKKWGWTDAGWGGDWLSVNDDAGKKLYFSEMKTAYLAHGPCLSEVRYDGNYGSAREVGLEAKVQTLRTDDFARTFQTLRYTFDQKLSAEDGWLFKMGRSGKSVSPQIAYGNAGGLVREEAVPDHLRKGELYLDRVALEGAAPWWVGFPGGYLSEDRDWGTGSRAWIIRSYRASLGGKVYTQPTISMPVYQVDRAGRVNLDLLLTPPAGVTEFLPGDTIEMEIEWMTFHREADDYYGLNEAYRQHLVENPRSWKTIYREAKGNDLKVQVQGGTLLHSYPIIVQADADAVRVKIEGGIGYVPIRFEGLESATGYTLYQIVDGRKIALDQSMHGNDFWQTDYDVASNTYKITYNLPLDLKKTSDWLLQRDD
ncbi:LamG domain-containing protein [Coraliomargarita algicola]|uniref:LamG domain-containing protein n=1 Tax=Coraliomargarita algicola TaxID=3092156 RepID=A0ABZ0RLB4_9BACT|nr:LamG domain-containing protein [Coraliomargarita sp. J2-16]WPJ96211.1 LamG domain-containing protein [Coraliomargarita sp. J2-16]